MANDGRDGDAKRPSAGRGQPEAERIPDESDLGQEIQGNNRLQGNDQVSVRNQRRTMPEENETTEGVVESFERMDPRKRD